MDLQADYDHQTEFASNPNHFNVHRIHVKGTLNINKISFYLGDHLLSSDNGEFAFQRDLASKHAFFGFADQFLVTPKGGLNDVEMGLVIKNLVQEGDNMKIAGHKFNSDVNSGNKSSHIGNEVDANYSIPADWVGVQGTTLQAQVAYYNGDKNSAVMPKDDIMVTGQAIIPLEKLLKTIIDDQQ
jgi:hypothetical protein